ncbi:MAG: NAD(P)/FAD-dependent oxidoreductase [Nocardioides sp.]|jgi:phytoene dehydrogenase-like protein
MRVTVLGGGFGGLASAARLAKLGHDVTLLERSGALGGAMSRTMEGGFAWENGPTTTGLPAVVRDLFRKSGRPLERELDLVPVPIIREHRFEDGSVIALPGETRAGQYDAVQAATSAGDAWLSYVDSFADVWHTLRRDYYERPYDPRHAERAATAILRERTSLHRRLRKTFKDERLKHLATYDAVSQGHDPRDVPAWVGLTAYLEQNFGLWTIPGPAGSFGLSALTDALVTRLSTRKVKISLNTDVRDVAVRDGRAVGVHTSEGDLDTDAVVVAIDPRRVPALAPSVRKTMPALPPTVCFLGLEGEVPDLPAEVVLHGDPTLTVRTGGQAPEGHHAWTVHVRGMLGEDLLRALARGGLDVRAQVVRRLDHTPREQVEQFAGSPMGVRWEGRGTVAARLGPRTPIPGVYAAGAHATPGAGVPAVGLSAALVAQVIGPA